MDKQTLVACATACACRLETFLPSVDDSGASEVDGALMSNEEFWAEEQLARFNLWAASLGVYASGHASVEHRLRDHPQIYKMMMQWLDALHAIYYTVRGLL